jgi:hypothetical protein
MTQDEMDAENRKYLDSRIILVPLRSGRFAVYNNAGELCAVMEPDSTINRVVAGWIAPKPVTKAKPTLTDLGL